MSSFEDTVRDCLARAVAAPPARAADRVYGRATGAIRRAHRVRRRQAAGGALAVLAATVLAGGALAWQAAGPGPQHRPAQVTVERAAFTMDGCGRGLRCAA